MMTFCRRLFGAIGIAFLLLSFAHTPAPVDAQSTLSNPSFDTPYSNGVASGWAAWHEERNVNANCDTESMYRQPSWSPEEIGGNGGELWFDGTRSQHVGNSFATWRGGVFQTLSVNPGTYAFSVKAWGRASQEQYPAASDQSVDFTIRVGISPSGSGNWGSSDIVWGPSISPHGTWQTASVEATTTGSSIGVYIAADFAGPGHCRKHLDAWFDAAQLVSSTPPTEVPPPTNVPPTRAPVQPTATPNWNATQTVIAQQATATPNWNATLTQEAINAIPTATNTPSASPTPFPTSTPTATPNWNATATVRARTATATPDWNATLTAEAQPVVATIPPVVIFQPTAIPVVPTETPVPTEVPVEDSAETDTGNQPAPPTEPPPPTETPVPTPSGGIICVNTFADENANGLRDPLEGYMASVPLRIGKDEVLINQGISNGTETPLCFEGLEPGEYQIAQELPGSLEMTTAGNLSIEVAQGQVIGLEFGSRFRQVPLGSDGGADQAAGGDQVASAENGNSQPVTSEQPAATPADGERNLSTATIAGIVLTGLAVLLLGGVLIALLRR